MAANENQSPDFYAVLGLKKDCSDVELKSAYKKLALRWHPDRCAAPGNSKYVEEAKKKFQAIQEAYSVLSDKNKRFMYDVGIYDSNDDDDDNGMCDFLNEMAAMMSQNQATTENVVESFEELKSLFEDMFQDDLASINSSSKSGATTSCSSTMFGTYGDSPSLSGKRHFEMDLRKSEVESSSHFDTDFQGFSLGAEHQRSHREGGYVPGEYKSRRSGRKQKVSSSHDVSSSNNAGISA